MEKSQVAELVVYAQSMQGREANELQVEAWHTVLADVEVGVAMARARAHFRTQPRELWPADVLRPTEDEFEGEEWVVMNR